MPEVLDWQRVAEPHAVIHYAVQSLRQGRTVAFPAETGGYTETASGLVVEAVRRLPAEEPGGTGVSPVLLGLTLALRGAAEARDWAPALSRLGLRLARRLWPGPVTLLASGDVELGLASRLPDEIRARFCVQNALRLAVPRHEALREVLRHLPGPLLMTAASADCRADVIIVDNGNGITPAEPQPATVVAVNGDSWQIVRPGATSVEEIRRQTACWIVFVCTGNTCRSPLAEALCKKLLTDRLGCAVVELPARGYHVASAGLSAMPGGPAAVEAEGAARGYGADLSAHRSQPLTTDLAVRADYLVGMTQSHLHAVMDYFGHLGLMPRLLDPTGDIADPIGGDQPVYDACARQIQQHLEALVAEILPAEAKQS
jgi:protein-tyrosine-phosphatase/tRNA A37 threonylcarbamoyladenosine synthetase subunit TsaC/SUA5/YrdC